MRKRTRRRFGPRWDLLDDRCLLSGYSPAQITAGYGLNAILFSSSSGATVAGNGAGQTIALVEVYHDPNIQSSLNVFDAKYGLPNITLNVINQAGNQTNAPWAGEESMDVEWAHAIAPAANIVVVEAAPGSNDTQGFNDLMTAVQTASQTNGVTVVSMSFGMSEFSGEGSDDSAFMTAGITYIASSGDQGTVDWPASAPDVLAVGGTTLSLGGSGVYSGENGWADTGGGLSQDEVEPSYQNGVQSTGQRTTPDVSFDADPNSGVPVYVIPPTGNGGGEWFVAGGTSLGAPAWAGVLAIVNQGRALAGQSSLTGATQTLPALYALPSSAFHKVGLTPTQGDNSTNQTINTAKYNTQGGLGTLNGAALIGALVSGSTTSTPTPTPTPTPTQPNPPSSPPAIPKPPPFTTPTPIPIPNPNPVKTPPKVPAPPTPAPPIGPTPATPAPAAPPTAVAVKGHKAPPRKRRAQSGHLVSPPKPILKSHVKDRSGPKAHGAQKGSAKAGDA